MLVEDPSGNPIELFQAREGDEMMPNPSLQPTRYATRAGWGMMEASLLGIPRVQREIG